MDFTNLNFTPYVAATNGAASVIGSAYKVTNVADLLGAGGINQIDAIFTVTDASIDSSSAIQFVDETRGDDVRVRFNKLTGTDIWVKIAISFVQSGTTTAVDVAAVTGSDLVLQFDDLDSDVGSNRADFAGLETSQIDAVALASNTLLQQDTSISSGYTIGHGIGTDWTSMDNVSNLDAISQSPVTIAFETTVSTLNIVLGVTGADSGDRHIDIDMTPDFTIVPEPSSYAFLIGIAAIGFVATRRRK
jgi:hypothetical protein